MKIYIAGKITGLPLTAYLTRFADAEKLLRDKGHTAFNPVHLGVHYLLPYEEYLLMGRVLIDNSDAIYMLDNWQDSIGARREKVYAESQGMKVFYEDRNR